MKSKIYKFTSLELFVFLLAGCNEDDVNKPRFFKKTTECSTFPRNCSSGSPENPCGYDYLTFYTDGKIDKTYDDIIETGEYEIMRNKLTATVTIDSFQDMFSYVVSEDELSLLNEYNEIVMKCDLVE